MNRNALPLSILLAVAIGACSSSYHPAAIRTFEPIDLTGVKPLPSFDMTCEAYEILPSAAVNIEICLPRDVIECEQVQFQLRDAKSHVVVLKSSLHSLGLGEVADKAECVRWKMEDAFHAPCANNPNARNLPVGCYYIEVVPPSGGSVIARSKLFIVRL